MIVFIGLIILGLLAGVASGVIGIGGGIIIIPALVFIFGLTQQQAQGTTLALLVPPIGIMAAWSYYKQGYVDIKIAGLICIGFVIGGLIGARYGTQLPEKILSKAFGGLLLFIAVKMLLTK